VEGGGGDGIGGEVVNKQGWVKGGGGTREWGVSKRGGVEGQCQVRNGGNKRNGKGWLMGAGCRWWGVGMGKKEEVEG